MDAQINVRIHRQLGMAHTYNTSTLGTKAGGPDQPKLQSKTLSTTTSGTILGPPLDLVGAALRWTKMKSFAYLN